MLITDRFVFVHMPKTGGTFVASVLKQIHEARGETIVRKKLDPAALSEATPAGLPLAVGTVKNALRGLLKPGQSATPEGISLALERGTILMVHHRQSNGEYNQHGITANIPPEHRHKPVLSVLRNPYDRYVSQFEYKWWANREDAFVRDMASVKAAYPNFPDLTFEEFIHASNTHRVANPTVKLLPDDRLGRQSTQFITYYYTDPERIDAIDSAYLDDKRYRDDLRPNLNFIFTEDLNQGLYDFLLRIGGYDEAEIAFVLTQGKIMPRGGGRSAEQRWEKYYTPELKAWVRHRERILFDLFPQWDI